MRKKKKKKGEKRRRRKENVKFFGHLQENDSNGNGALRS
jgi:hypothetical protein